MKIFKYWGCVKTKLSSEKYPQVFLNDVRLTFHGILLCASLNPFDINACIFQKDKYVCTSSSPPGARKFNLENKFDSNLSEIITAV